MGHIKRKVSIVSRRCVQNELLCCHIDKKDVISCICVDTFAQIPASELNSSDIQQIILFDCLGVDSSKLLEIIHTFPFDLSPRTVIALMNLDENDSLEKAALNLGIRGFFYTQDSLATLLKGIEALSEGELWLSRKKLSECLLDRRQNVRQKALEKSVLTRREEEILRLMAQGDSNEAIAASLCISPHTVRTHNYNIFKKIDVPNRLQASLWANRYL